MIRESFAVQAAAGHLPQRQLTVGRRLLLSDNPEART
jgi:hypothetical protein